VQPVGAGAIHVGCCGFALPQARYFRTVRLLEVQQTFYQPPRLATPQRWRAAASRRWARSVARARCRSAAECDTEIAGPEISASAAPRFSAAAASLLDGQAPRPSPSPPYRAALC
jgi:hypothetical protein